MNTNKLSFSNKVGYGVADLGGNLFFTIVNYWLLYFLTDIQGLNPVHAGIAIMIGKIWDAVIDPVIGFISDKTVSRWGRRKPFMVAGLPLLYLLTVLLFTKNAIAIQEWMFVYVTIIYCLVNTAYSIVYVPYYAMLPELTEDYHERTSLFGYRMVFTLIGTIVGSVMALPIIGIFPSKTEGFIAMSLIFGAVMIIAVILTILLVPTVKYATKMVQSGIFKSYLNVFRNKPFVLVIISQSLCFIALVFGQGSVYYFYNYVLKQPDRAILGLICMTIPCVLFIPVTLALSRKFGKKATWIGGMIVSIVGAISLFFVSNSSLILVLICQSIVGMGSSATFVLSGSCVTDTIEFGCLQTSDRSEGSYMGMNVFFQKVGMALGVACTGWILSASGYVANQAQTAEAEFAIRCCMTLIPAAFLAIAVIVINFYPITEKEYKRIVEEINLRNASGGL